MMDRVSIEESTGLETLVETEGARRATAVSTNVRRNARDPSKGESRMPDPEVSEKPMRRRFTTEYKLRILREVEASKKPGAVGAILRREGLYSSTLSGWRRQMKAGLAARKRGRKKDPASAEKRRNAELEREIKRLRERLSKAETIIEVQKKVSLLLGVAEKPPESDGSSE